MYCAIRNYNDYNFNGDKTHIKEYIYNYNSDMVSLLKETKDKENIVIKMPNSPTKAQLEYAKMFRNARTNARFMVADELIDELPCFFQPGVFNADSLDKLKELCEMGVTDVYVSGSLGFDLKSARIIADKYNVKIRVIPNMAQVATFGLFEGKRKDISSFWIRPEDIHMYEDLVDVIEFIGNDKKQSTFYEIYFQSKTWKGNLAVIIAGLEDVNNIAIPKEFTERRLDCGKKCLIDKCHSCFKYKNLADLAKEHNLEVEVESE